MDVWTGVFHPRSHASRNPSGRIAAGDCDRRRHQRIYLTGVIHHRDPSFFCFCKICFPALCRSGNHLVHSRSKDRKDPRQIRYVFPPQADLQLKVDIGKGDKLARSSQSGMVFFGGFVIQKNRCTKVGFGLQSTYATI